MATLKKCYSGSDPMIHTQAELVDARRSYTVQQNNLDPLWLFILAFMIAALAGVATVLRTVEKLTARVIITAILNSGALGLCIALILFTYFKDNTWFLLGLCLLAGLGGMTALGFTLMLVRTLLDRGGLNVHIEVSQHIKDKDKE